MSLTHCTPERAGKHSQRLSYCSKVRAAKPSSGRTRHLQRCFFPLDDSMPEILCRLVLVKRQKLVTVSVSSYSGISPFSFRSLVHARSSGKTEEAETGREKSSSHLLLLTCIPTWMRASGCGRLLRIAHLMGNLHATAQINLSCELHESGARCDRFMDVGLGLKHTPSRGFCPPGCLWDFLISLTA